MSWTYFLPCLWSFLACFAFCFIFNIRNLLGMIFCSIGGSLGWLIYLLCTWWISGNLGILLSSFVAAVVVSFYSECMARIRKCPATGYLTISLLPLVPGAGIYYTMEYALLDDTEHFLNQGMLTLGTAISLAVGVLVVSSGIRIYYWLLAKRKYQASAIGR